MKATSSWFWKDMRDKPANGRVKATTHDCNGKKACKCSPHCMTASACNLTNGPWENYIYRWGAQVTSSSAVLWLVSAKKVKENGFINPSSVARDPERESAGQAGVQVGCPSTAAPSPSTHTFTPGLNVFGQMWGQRWNTEWAGNHTQDASWLGNWQHGCPSPSTADGQAVLCIWSSGKNLNWDSFAYPWWCVFWTDFPQQRGKYDGSYGSSNTAFVQLPSQLEREDKKWLGSRPKLLPYPNT